MIDFTRYRTQDLYLILKDNDKYRSAIATKKRWEDVLKVIDSLNIKYTQEQIDYVKLKGWD